MSRMNSKTLKKLLDTPTGPKKNRPLESILILDGDGKLSSEFIEKAMPLFFTDKEIAGVQGRYVPSNRNYNFVTRLLPIEGDLWSTPYMTIRTILNKQVYLVGTGFIIRKDVLNAVGRFNNHLGDDYD